MECNARLFYPNKRQKNHRISGIFNNNETRRKSLVFVGHVNSQKIVIIVKCNKIFVELLLIIYNIFRTLSNISAPASSNEDSQSTRNELNLNIDTQSTAYHDEEDLVSWLSSPAPSAFTPKPSKKRRISIETNDLLKEFLTSKRPTPIEFLQQEKPTDSIQLFFDSMASTVRTFSPLSIARIKLRIAQIVGQEEIACAEKQARESENVQYFVVENLTQEKTDAQVQQITNNHEE